MASKNYYHLLNVSESASLQEIKSAYHLLAKVLHPDRFNKATQRAEWEKANDLLKDLNEAYSVLRDPARRERYDQTLRAGTQSPPRSSQANAGPSSSYTHPPQGSTRASTRPPSNVIRTGTVDITRLPGELRARIVNGTMNNASDHLILSQRTPSVYVASLLIAIIMPIVSLFMTKDYLWSRDQTLVLGLCNILSLAMLGVSLVLLHAWRYSSTRPRVLVTPMYIIHSSYDRVRFRWLWDMEDFRVTHNHSNGTYSSTTVDIKYADASETLSVNHKGLADMLLARLKSWDQEIRREIQDNDYEKLIKNDLFLGLKKEHLSQDSFWLKGKYVACISACLILFVPFYLALSAMNKYWDDSLSWQHASLSNSASAYRLYLATHGKGRWQQEAKKRIAALYDRATSDYSNGLSRGFEDSAVESVIGLLQSAKYSGNYEVPVAFFGSNNLPADLETTIAQEYAINNVIPVGDAFSIQNMTSRESRIFSETKQAFSKAIPGDILDLRLTSDSKGAKILIGYTVQASASLYYRDTEKLIPAKQRPFYPGITLEWKCYIFGDAREPYQFALTSNPAESFTDTRRGVYEDMTDSAFANFRNELIRRIGLR